MFNKIYNDEFIKDAYVMADDPNSKDGFWVYHGLNHINNVIELVEAILKELNYDEEFIENAKIAALLHDVGYGGIKKEHDIRSYEISKKYLIDNKIKLKHKDEVLEAIRLHRGSTDTNNVIALVLILADKLDIKKNRLTEEGYEIEGLRQYQFIEDIEIKKDNNEIEFKFIINSNVNRRELEDWYFIKKVFSSIKNFSNHFGFNYKILFNDTEWKLKNNQ